MEEESTVDREQMVFKLEVEPLTDSKYLMNCLNEIIDIKYKLRISVYRNEEYKLLYLSCIERAVLYPTPYLTFDDILHKRYEYKMTSTILNEINYPVYYGAAHYIVSPMFGLVKIDNNYYILIQKWWDYFLLCTPMNNYSFVGWSQDIFDHLCEIYPNKTAHIYHMI